MHAGGICFNLQSYLLDHSFEIIIYSLKSVGITTNVDDMTGRMHEGQKLSEASQSQTYDKSQSVEATELMPEDGTQQEEDHLALSEESDFEGLTGLLAATFM